MIDASVLVNPVNAGDWGLQQSLPAPQAQDIKRFEDFLTQGGIGGGVGVDASQAVKDQPVLSVVEPSSDAALGGLKQAILSQVQSMDSSYHNALSSWHDMPSLKVSLKTRDVSANVDQLRSYPEVGSHRDMSAQIQETSGNAVNTILAAAEYQNGIYKWATKMEVWSSHMKLLSSAVGQLSQGFKTLFQAG